jgi:hypothetical protein
MTATGDPISNLVVSRCRPAVALPALILDASIHDRVTVTAVPGGPNLAPTRSNPSPSIVAVFVHHTAVHKANPPSAFPIAS